MNNKYLNSSIKIIILLIVGKVLGFVKQLIVGWSFGANISTDIFFIAEGFVASINNAIFVAFSVTFLRNYIVERDASREKAKIMASDTFFMGTIAAFIIMIIYNISISGVSKLLAPSYSIEQRKLLEEFMILLSPVIFIYSMTSILGAILDGEELFTFSKLSGIVISISYIVICIVLGKRFNTFSLVIANIIGYLLYFVCLIIVLHNKTDIRLLKPKYNKKIINIIKLAVPVMLGNAAADFNAIIDKTIATKLSEGSVSALYYGQVASNDIINGVFINAIGSILITHFTGLALETDNIKVKKSASDVMSILVMLIVPVSIIFLMFGNSIASLLFEHGALYDSKTRLIADCMKGYAIGFPFLAVREVLIKIHYSYNDMKQPMINGCIAIGINIVLSILLAKPFGVFGITVASSFSIMIAVILLEKSVKKLTNMYIFLDKKIVLQIFIAGVIAEGVLQCIHPFLNCNELLELIVLGTICISVYLLVLILLGNQLIKKYLCKIITNFFG